MRSAATTVEQYLSELPEDRRTALRTVRQVILENLPSGYEEAMNWGMIAYQVPLSVHPDTYNGQPLMYAALASQKHYMSVYLVGIYMKEEARREFEEEYRDTGKPLDVGKSCMRFKRIDDLPLALIGRAIAAYEVADFVRQSEELRSTHIRKPPSDKRP